MATLKPVAQTIVPWLKANLGPRCLAPLTGQDAKALLAAVQIVDLYSYDRDPIVATAFQYVVMRMQPHCREFAYHAVAHVLEWQDRARFWNLAGLPPIENPRKCAFES